jgi:hypothetical protein
MMWSYYSPEFLDAFPNTGNFVVVAVSVATAIRHCHHRF